MQQGAIMKYTLALCQFFFARDKEETIRKAGTYIARAADAGARVVSLPEMWNCPYDHKYFAQNSEPEGGMTFEFLSESAKKHGIWLIGGSIPESDATKIYNTSFCFDPDGQLIGKHRKIHMFDISIKGGFSFRESDTLSPGDKLTVFDTEFGKIGVAICYDIRFPKLFSDMAERGACLIVLPASFSATTGPAHWELLIRARALDNQIYFAASAPARDPAGSYNSHAHSLVVNPWGEMIGAAALDETIVYSEIDLDYLAKVREEIPLAGQVRDYR